MARSMFTRAAGLLAAFALTAPASVSAQAMPGAPAPTIALEAIENAPADLGMSAEDVTWDALAGKTVVLEFWATWCGPCIAAIPHLNELAESYEGADDVVFLSITDEPVDLVNEFRTKRKMKSWIGHDLDRDTIDAFDIRGIPRTFLIHDGRVMAAAHPMQVTREHIETARRGEIVDDLSEGRPRFRSDVSNDAEEGATVQWMGGGGEDTPSLQAGLDPYTMLSEPPALQVIVRELDAFNIGSWSGPNEATMLGRPVADIVQTLWQVPGYAIDLDDSLLERHFDVVVRMPEDQLRVARSLVAAGMGVSVESQPMNVRGWRATLDGNGHRLAPHSRPISLGHRVNTTREAVTVTTDFNTVRLLFAQIERHAGGPVIDETGLGDQLFAYEVTIPLDNEAMPAAIFEATGIRLEPIETEIEGVVVRPIEP